MTVTTGFLSMAEHHPQRRAMVGPDGVILTYGELASKVFATAHLMRELGLRRGDAIGVALPNGPDHLAVHAAAMISGLYVVPVNWHLTGAEIAYILDNSGAELLVAHERFAEQATAAADEVGIAAERRLGVGWIDGFTSLATATAGRPEVRPDWISGGNPMFYTSGTTGRPKGIRKPLPEGPAGTIGVTTTPVEVIDGVPVPLEQVHIASGPLYFAAPLHAAASTLDAGAFLVLMERFDPARWLELVAEHGVTHATMVPIMFSRLLALDEQVREAADVSSLVSVTHAGAPCPVQVKSRMIEWLGPIVNEYYASSEGAAGTAITSEEWLRKPGSVGRPRARLQIVDEDGNECPPNVPGAVYLESIWEWEYHKDADKTASAFRGDLFTVGDIGYLDEDGYLFLCDRSSELIISGGANIYPREVEDVLLTHPAVGDAAVIGAPDDEWGERVVAVVEPAVGVEGGAELADELIELCRDRLAHFKCPRQVDFTDSLGRDPNGKLRKHLVRDRYWVGHDRKI